MLIRLCFGRFSAFQTRTNCVAKITPGLDNIMEDGLFKTLTFISTMKGFIIENDLSGILYLLKQYRLLDCDTISKMSFII